MACSKPFHMSDEEKRLAREWHFDDGQQPADIAKKLKRSISAVTRLLAQKKVPAPVGRPKALTKAQIDRIIRVTDELVDKAEATKEITAEIVRKRARVSNVSIRVGTRLGITIRPARPAANRRGCGMDVEK